MGKLGRKPVVCLMGYDFYIPDYQRGYKWDKRQVVDLLEDIWDFHQKSEEGEAYCLQPLITINRENSLFEVIDGQQRLTTIYIVLLFKKILVDEMISKKWFSIAYQTRQKSRDFLEKINKITIIENSNADFYYMSQAYFTVKEWFEKTRPNVTEFLNTLLYKVEFIWYELEQKTLSSDITPREIFSRVNMGKIPLTNAELIKALFLKDEREDTTKIGFEWDNIENTMQNHDFWFFITGSNLSEKANRIELIFELIAEKYSTEKSIEELKIDKKHESYWVFYIFNELIEKDLLEKERGEKFKCTKDYLWDQVKSYFRTFDEWFHNIDYYHLAGYLFQVGEKIEKIKNIFEENDKNEFVKELKRTIKEKLNLTENSLVELSYLGDSDKITNILLLFNVITSMESGYIRFPFDRYIKENWSLEHIHAQNSKNLKNNVQRKLLLEEQRKYANDREVGEIDDLFLEKDEDVFKAKFESFENRLFEQSTDDDSDGININSLKNIALLSRNDNSSLNNNIFPIKRKRIKELDEKGSFIPICTKNVFMKYYSTDVEQIVKWDKSDMDSYFGAIKNTLAEYLKEDVEK
jgi:uncharacterized protein with ParB-like and HNH nuclease domain